MSPFSNVSLPGPAMFMNLLFFIFVFCNSGTPFVLSESNNYFGIMLEPESSLPNTSYIGSAVNFTNNAIIPIGNLFNAFNYADGCYQTESTYFWTFYGTDIFTSIPVTDIYTVDLSGKQYIYSSFPNQTINYYCTQLIDFPAAAVTVNYNPKNAYLMDIYFVFESPIEHNSDPYLMPISKDFIKQNYSIITGLFHSLNNLIIFHKFNESNSNVYDYAIYSSQLNEITAYNNANCTFGYGVIDTFYINLQMQSWFITKDDVHWMIGILEYKQNQTTFNYDVSECHSFYPITLIPINDSYRSGDINRNANKSEIVVLMSSGVYLIDMDINAPNVSKVTLPNGYNFSSLASINFAQDLY